MNSVAERLVVIINQPFHILALGREKDPVSRSGVREVFIVAILARRMLLVLVCLCHILCGGGLCSLHWRREILCRFAAWDEDWQARVQVGGVEEKRD